MYVGVGGKIILKWILRELEWGCVDCVSRFEIGVSGCLL
jgi:hypothetical protein